MRSSGRLVIRLEQDLHPVLFSLDEAVERPCQRARTVARGHRPPEFRAEAGATRATLFGPRRFADMTTEERLRACHQHAVLRYLSGKRMKNSTLRERFGVDSRNAARISQVIRRALDEQLIRVADPARPRSGYIPFWA